ncbi:MAG TPA: cupredoxin domain-containing protein [Candidatus Limnocylindria bacterium]|nr:cupredoxin domain-containing protein [Candidatus Limnocylindria bacterium]
MRPPRSVRLVRIAAVPVLVAIMACVAAACVSTASPGWTFVPPPPSSAAPSVSGSAGPSGSPAASPSAASSAAASGATGTVVNLKAQNIAFDPKSLTAPPGVAFQIAFDNQDNATMHDVQIKDGSGKEVFKGDLVTGVAQKTYDVPALQAGNYTFTCTVHPTMTGTLEVK